MIGFFLSILDIFNILIKTIRFSVINVPIENSSMRLVRMLGFLNPFYIVNRNIPAGQRIANFLESLGPMFIKFGQDLKSL